MSIFIESGLASSSSGADEFITEDLISTGSVVWVDSQTGSDSNSGSEAQPVATLAKALTLVSPDFGDIIVLVSGHAETVTASIAVSKSGTKIFGIGNGSSAPRFTAAAAIDVFHITGDNVELNNLYFPVGTTIANTSRVKADAENVRLKGCTFLCGAYDTSSVLLTANALFPRFESCSFTVSAVGPSHGILVQSAAVEGLFIKDCSFDGGAHNFGVAALYSAYAHLNFFYQTITLTGDAPIKHTGNAKGILSNIIAAQGSTVQT